jgi:iron only hydrogenase large subunit-like protein
VNARSPIYTATTECQDCYKCIRGCPVKAIKVEGGYASIEENRCVFCGQCVEMCPNGAKKVRDDCHRVERLLKTGQHVAVSLAPSFVSEFPGVTAAQMIAALRCLGFSAVSETALGAEEVSARLRMLLASEDKAVWISSACPVVVEYIRKYRPACTSTLTPLLSPMLSHARLLRRELADDIRVVFIGPCIAKKREADTHADLIDAALTFEDLREWMKRAGIKPEEIDAPPDSVFVPRQAGTGALYPVEGGMVRSLRAKGASAQFMSFSGLGSVVRALEGIEEFHSPSPLFLELLACEGGCINGPKTSQFVGTVRRRHRVLRYARPGEAGGDSTLALSEGYAAAPPPGAPAAESQIREVLRAVGKHSPQDELNCGGCGYDSCRAFATAFLMGRAERRMCVTYMRKLAEKKTYALMQKMPSAVVLVDENLRILECNPSFVRFFARAGEGEPQPRGLEGQPLDSLVPFYNLFETVLQTGEEIPGKDIRFRGSVFHVTIFSVEKNAVVGGIFRDETQPAVHKEQIIDRARQVIEKNLHTVQQIAYLLGENAADSEIALNSIVDSLTPERVDEDGEPQ